jgi:DNA-binding GntR family transcriptional regulator
LTKITPIDWSNDGRPLYRQIVEQLRRLIENGDYSPGDRIPSEGEMERIYRCSRGTVRKACEVLEHDKLIYKKRGVGTFVSGAPSTRA